MKNPLNIVGQLDLALRRVIGCKLINAISVFLVLVISVCVSHPSAAQTGSKDVIQIVTGTPAGASVDMLARLLARRMSETLGKRIIVDNKPGAAGILAAQYVAHAAPDGATMYLAPLFIPVVAPLVYKSLPYDPEVDFAPVALATTQQIAIAVEVHQPWQTVAEFVQWAKAHPDKSSYGTPGAGSVPHFLGLAFGKAADIPYLHVPYRGGQPIVTALLGGEIPTGITGLADFLQYHRSGQLRILATAGAKRSAMSPDIPTLVEAGYPDLEASFWFAFLAPAKTPRPVIDQLNSAIVSALGESETIEKLLSVGQEPTPSTPDGLASVILRDRQRWTPVIKASGFTANE